MQFLRTSDADFPRKFDRVVRDRRESDAQVGRDVATMINEVRERGDSALVEYTTRFDGHHLTRDSDWQIPLEECRAAYEALDADLRDALELAASRIRAYHEGQLPSDRDYTDDIGMRLGARWRPVDAAGLYVPGGRAAYPSSLLMNAIPARVAGVERLVVTTPTPKGEVNPLVLAAAHIAGVDEIWRVGGAQAVAALAYGTKRIGKVDVIAGPGNAWVAEAKRQLYGVVGIDMIAGPSEILIICDGNTDPDWIAMDLFSQAEHDEDAQSILLCPDLAFIDKVEKSIEKLLPSMDRKDIIKTALKNRGALIHTKDMDEAIAISNRIAPEHLELSVENPEALLDSIKHAGAIFMGKYTCEALGDYCAGPNHVLPTSGTARFSSPLGVYDFQKKSSLIMASKESANTLGKVAATLADGEGLQAHAQSAKYRFNKP